MIYIMKTPLNAFRSPIKFLEDQGVCYFKG